MELQIIESISKHAVTLVLVIGILMLTCNSDIPDYRNMSADKQRDCPHRDDYAAVACRRILRFPVQDTGHYFQDSYSSVHCRIICRITQNINIHIWKQLL